MKKYIITFVFCSISIFLLGQTNLEKIKKLQDEKNYYEAIKGYEQILLQDPYNKDALRNIIDLYININDYKSSFCLLYTSPSPRDRTRSRMPSSA